MELKYNQIEMDYNEIANQIFEGDCIEVLRQFPDNCIDMVLCDLPYGTTQNKWDSIIPLEQIWHGREGDKKI